MQKFNVLLIGYTNSRVLPLILRSKYLNKLYTNFEYEDFPNIQFNTFRELAEKCKAVKVDVVIVENEKYIMQGIADVLKANFVNCVAINAFWSQLVLSNEFAKTMLNKYEIKTPETVIFPNEFPVVFRAKRILQYAYSLDDVIKLKKKIFEFSPEISKTVFLEKYIVGKEFVLTSLFDGKHLVTLPVENLDEKFILEYNNKLEKMFTSENSGFIGFINSRVMISDDSLYSLEFKLEFPDINQDVLYIIMLAIYQKLDEISIC